MRSPNETGFFEEHCLPVFVCFFFSQNKTTNEKKKIDIKTTLSKNEIDDDKTGKSSHRQYNLHNGPKWMHALAWPICMALWGVRTL